MNVLVDHQILQSNYKFEMRIKYRGESEKLLKSMWAEVMSVNWGDEENSEKINFIDGIRILYESKF